MKAYRILILTLFCAHLATSKPYQRDDGFTEDKERYADLLVDPYAVRFLDRFLDLRDSHLSASRPDKEEVENSIWYSQQGEKSFPLLLEVIRREEGNLGSVRIDKALARVMRYPGDKTAFVEEIRRRLPQWKNEGFEPKQYNNMVTMSFRLLAEEGDESDIALTESMLDTDPERPVYQEQIDSNVNLLKERLVKVKERQDKRNSREAISLPEQSNQRKTAVNGDEGKTAAAPRKTLWVFLSIALFLPLLVLAIRCVKR